MKPEEYNPQNYLSLLVFDFAVNWIHYMSKVLSGWKNISTKLARYNDMEFPNAKKLKKQTEQNIRY
jgi:hypothetical protein